MAICTPCHGTGKVTYKKGAGYLRAVYTWQEVCHQCGGYGIVQCREPDESRDLEQPAPEQKGGSDEG